MIVAEKGSKGRSRRWKVVDAKPMETEDKQQRKQRLHREEMVQFRLRKKLRESRLRTEHAQLEGQMQRCLAALKRAVAKDSEKNAAQKEVTKTHQNLVLQAEALRFQNQKLQKVVTDYDKLQKVIHAEGERAVKADNSQSLLGGSSWLVTFPNHQPPFHFHPFTKKDSEEIIQSYDQTMAIGASDFFEVGTLLGWRVDRLPLVQHANGRWMVTRVKFSKQIRCPAGESEATMETLEATSWPVLTAPELCPCVHRSNSTSLKLQEIDNDTVVIVSDTPEQSRGMNLRYLTMIHRRRSVDNEGRRCITYVMTIPDSKANKRNREAEQSRDRVLWVCEGAAYMTLKQIDNSTLEVSYDNCNGCKNELHAQQLLIEWAHEAIRWEQLVTPSRLLAM